MFDPKEFRVDTYIEGRIEDCVNAVRDALEMYSCNPTYERDEDAVYDDKPDLAYATELDMTEDFMERFLNEEEGYVPSMLTAMRLINVTDLGAKAFQFIDVSDKVIGVNPYDKSAGEKELVCAGAIAYCIECIDDENHKAFVTKEIAKMFSTDEKNLYQKLKEITTEEFVNYPVTKILKMTLLIGLPIQALFGYKFYTFCEVL